MYALIVDDSRATRAILARIVTGLGFEVLQAADGREALEVLEAHPGVVFALVDWNMPVMDGLQFVRTVRQRPQHAGTRLVMVTTEGDTDRMILALESGADEYAMKPFTASVIQEKLDLLGISPQGEMA